MSTTPATAASPTDILAEITDRIADDGLDPDCSDEEKLLYVWRLLQQTELDLQLSVENEERLRKTQAEEMHEVESYVEHIRHLSDERELLIQELETENDQLKFDNRDLKRTMKGFRTAELSASEKLLEQGLEEMASASISEQIAFLLVERARMVHEAKSKTEENIPETNVSRSETEVKVHEAKVNQPGPEVKVPEVKVIPESETTESVEETSCTVEQRVDAALKEERERMKLHEDKMRVAHEEEINCLMDETDKLEEQLAELQKEKEVIEDEKNRLQAELDRELKRGEETVTSVQLRPASPARTNSDLALRKIIADKTQIECELVALKSRSQQLESDNENLTMKITSLEQAVDVAKAQKLSFEAKLMKANAELSDVQQVNADLKIIVEKTGKENIELEKSRELWETTLKEKQDKLDSLEGFFDSLHQEKSELMEMMEKLREEKDASIAQTRVKFDEDLRKKDETMSQQMKMYEDKIMVLKKELEDLHGAKSEVASQKDRLDVECREKQEVSTRLEECLHDLSVARDTSQELMSKNQSFKSALETLEQRYSEDTEGLKAKLQLSLQEFAKLRSNLEQEKGEKSRLAGKLAEADDKWRSQNQELQTENEINFSKVQKLEKRIQEMQDDMFLNQEELENSHGQYEEVMEKLRQEKLNSETKLQNKVETIVSQSATIKDELDETKRKNLALETKLNDHLVELKSKDNTIKRLTDELESMKSDVGSMESKLKMEQEKTGQLSQESCTTKKELRDSIEKLKNSHQIEIEDFMHEIAHLESVCAEKQREIGEKSKNWEVMETDMSQKIVHLQQSYEKIVQENRDLHSKLKESSGQCKQLENKLAKLSAEKRGRLNSTKEQLEHSQQEVNSAQERVKQLREESQVKQQKITAMEMDAVNSTAKHEETMHQLQMEHNTLKLQHTKEVASLNERLGEYQKEMSRLQNASQLTQTSLELRQNELQEARLHESQLESEIAREKQLRGELQGKNDSLDAEINKLWTQVAHLNEKITKLENTKKALEVELETILVPISRSEKFLHNSSSVAEYEMNSLKTRCEAAETKVERLQIELSETIVKMQTAERRCYDDTNNNSRSNPGDRQALQEAMLQRTMLEQTVNELQQQVSVLKSRESQLNDRSRELQHRMIDMDSEMSRMRDRAQLAAEIEALAEDDQMSQKAEDKRRKTSEKIVHMQRDLKTLQEELKSANDKRDMWERRYDDRRMRMRSKLSKAREFYTEERKKLREQVLKLSEDLRVTKTSLSMEQQWKEKMDTVYHNLLDEKRLLLSQLAEQGETSRDQLRQLSILDSRAKFLEKENSQLQEKVDGQHENKQPLVGKNFSLDYRNSWRLPRARSTNSITVTTSGLGNSMDSSWDQDRLSDAMATITAPASAVVKPTVFHSDADFSGSEVSFEV